LNFLWILILGYREREKERGEREREKGRVRAWEVVGNVSRQRRERGLLFS
jgi:hypothetical protein